MVSHNEPKMEYEDRIKRATPLGLVKITYEMIFENIEKSKTEPSEDTFRLIVKLVDSLISGLDLNEEVSSNLVKTYIQVKACIHEAIIKCGSYIDKDNKMKEIMELIVIAESHLKIVYEAVSVLKDDGVPIYNPKVTAGLSYDKVGNMVENSESTIELKI